MILKFLFISVLASPFTVPFVNAFSVTKSSRVGVCSLFHPFRRPTFHHTNLALHLSSDKDDDIGDRGGALVTTPTPDQAVGMGARDWREIILFFTPLLNCFNLVLIIDVPFRLSLSYLAQQVRTGSWFETLSKGETVTRYILEGEGFVTVTAMAVDKKKKVGPGTLVEAKGPVELRWKVFDAGNDGGKGKGEMIVLTPGYEEGASLAIVAVAFVVLCAVLVSFGGGS